jgi:hypothetical protein
MNKLWSGALYPALALCTSALLQADPALNLPSASMSCSITVTSLLTAKTGNQPTSDGKHQPPAALTITAVQMKRAGKLQQALITYSDGESGEVWTDEGTGLTVVEQTSGTGKFVFDYPKGDIFRNGLYPLILDLTPDSLNWISPQNVTGTVPYKGRPALHYQKSVTILLPQPDPPRTVLYQAWVDPKTLSLLALADGDASYQLTFGDPPASPLALPSRFQAEFQRYNIANAPPVHN